MIALLLLSTLPQTDLVVRAQCDITELNHVYDGEGREVLVQVICWDQYPDGRYHCRLWKMEKAVSLSVLRHGSEIWFDEQGQTAQIRSLTFWESWETFDPELADRSCVPQDSRPKLQLPQECKKKTSPATIK